MKKIFLFLFSFLLSFSFVQAESFPIHKIFKDIDENYKYYDELQILYDRWIIFPDKNWNFNPKSKITRDEFVWIVSEISCKECIKPNVDFSYVEKYSNSEVFFDVSKNDKYFYCIAEAINSWEIAWYDLWTTCQNWVSRPWEKPFCPQNNIILEEALAIILRSWNILSISEAELIRDQIKSWKIFPNIWNIYPKLQNGAVYSFYPDFKKALEYTFLDFDKNWNQKKLKLLDFNSDINPKQYLTKEDFLRISYIALKNNSCKPKKDNDFWLKIEVLDKTCSEGKQYCKNSDFSLNEKIFDFRAKNSNYDSNWFTYSWRFYDYSTWSDLIKSWKFIDNHNFLKDWFYRVYLTATSPNWKTSEVYNDIKISKGNNNSVSISDLWSGESLLSSSILVDKLTTYPWDSISFTWITNNSDVTYSWDFWDWKKSSWKDIKKIFSQPWIYNVSLVIKDKLWNISTSTVNIHISNTPWFDWWIDSDLDWVPDKRDYEKNTSKDKINYICNIYHIENELYFCSQTDLWVYKKSIENDFKNIIDSDSDNVVDNLDYCPDIKWSKENFWCPIFDEKCNKDSDCKNWFFCNNWYCSVKSININCSYSWGHIISWNLECNSCPCDYDIDFRAKLRACDIIFPAITSPDYKDIYSKWKYFQIKK